MNALQRTLALIICLLASQAVKAELHLLSRLFHRSHPMDYGTLGYGGYGSPYGGTGYGLGYPGAMGYGVGYPGAVGYNPYTTGLGMGYPYGTGMGGYGGYGIPYR
ncbi:hypothetical protein DdX_12844 [Ditylenchus destructor]|uniref:Uncharacterized protein n=1 Tax=Ditylenchus destructor TaxID=166010 RepID=A0AAD4R395_9BILA|nr:hypothetical protein DdX_12844 [Ditylenchus destructor]